MNEVLILLGTAGIASLLFWMALYVAGTVIFIPGAIALFLLLLRFRPRMKSAQLMAEQGVFACLLAAQASLLAAVLMYVLPNLLRQATGAA